MTLPSMTAEAVSERSAGTAPIRLMKVLTTFFHGGTERQVLNLIRGMDRDRFDLSFACMRREGDYLEAFEALEAPIDEFRIRQLYHPRTFMQQLRFASFLRQRRVQILHSYNFYANAFAVPAARLAGVPVVLASVRDRGVYLTPAQTRLQRWACGLADRVLVNADSIGDWLVELGLDRERISVIRNGLDLAPYENPEPRGHIRREFDIPESAPVVILVARLNPQKGIEDYIRAAAKVAETRPDVRFLIVGMALQCKDGVGSEDLDYPAAMQALAASLGVAEQVIFTGHRDDTPDLLAEADISVLPSLSEGLSNTILESMATGLPTIATDVGGNPELVKEGVNGLLVPVQSPDRLATAMESLLADPERRRTLGEAARAMAREEYALSVMASKTQRLYRDELKHSRRAVAWQ